ncbi:MAG: biotin synthase BioB [Clostridium sp.]
MEFLEILKEKILNGYKVTEEEAKEIYLYDFKVLTNIASEITEKMCGKKIDLCSIINGKSGNCSEDCSFCAQSKHFNTGIKEYGLLKYEMVKKAASESASEGVHRFSIVTSGKGLDKKSIEKVAKQYRRLKEEVKISLCASHGILPKESLKILRDSGVKRYHHNLETSKNYYSEICTTHSYEERIETILNAKKLGFEICSGGIIGMGESIEDRIDLAILLRELEVKSIPINILMKIDGTPLEKQKELSEEEILRTISMFRFVNPTANLRLAAGRNLLTNYGEKAFLAGANATITGNLLTTCGNNIKEDKDLIKKIERKIK